MSQAPDFRDVIADAPYARHADRPDDTGALPLQELRFGDGEIASGIPPAKEYAGVWFERNVTHNTRVRLYAGLGKV